VSAQLSAEPEKIALPILSTMQPSALLARIRALRLHPTSLGLIGVLLFFALLKVYSLNFVLGDEHMYLYMSVLVSKGKWPYRDFFFSHPPLQLYVMGALFKVFGYSLVLSKLLPSAAAMVSALHVHLVGRRLVGRIEGLLAATLFLFTYDVLRGSSHFTGANCALALGLAATYQALVGRQVLAGVLFGLGTFTGIYIAPLGLMLGVLMAFRSWKESLRLLGTFGLTCVLVCALFAGVAGWHPFWYQIFGYNLNKIAFRYSWFAKFRNVAYLNTLVMLGFVPGIAWAVAMWKVRGRSHGSSVLPGFIGKVGAWLNLWGGDRVAAQVLFATLTCGYFYFYSTRVDYYSYYFMLIMPWMGLMTATFVVDVVRFIRERKQPAAAADAPLPRAEKRRRDRAAHKVSGRENAAWRVWPLAVAGVALAVVLVYRQGISHDRQAEMGEEGSHYVWHDSRYLPAWLNGLVQAVFWSPSSDPVHPPNAITYYLQHESMHATTVDKFVQIVRGECRPGERIFGEYSLGPFAAALGPCVLAANLADTNPHRFKVHESTPEGWVAALEADHLDIAIIAPGSAMLKERALRDYFLKTFPRTVATWDDPYAGHVELRRRN
jgi:Dolichyl-phosphate-mannose-protein mannosyltransferase